MDSFAKITEKQLREYDEAGVISSARIIKTPDGYVLVVQVTWKRGDLVVFNRRGQARTWASMDRLLRHIQETMPSIKAVDLQLQVVPGTSTGPTSATAPSTDAGKQASKGKASGKTQR